MQKYPYVPMPSPYRPRPIEIKQCEHCGISFETRHERTRYCSNSHRTKAYHARHGRQRPKAEPELAKVESEGVELALSWNNLLVNGTAVGLVDAVKHLFTQSDQNQENVIELTQAVRTLSEQISLLGTDEDRARIKAGQKALERQEASHKTAGR